MRKYKVIIRFRNTIPVSNRIDNYLSLGVSFEYEHGKIQGLTHQFSVNHELNHEERIIQSNRLLVLLWELLQYQYGLPIEYESCRSEEVGVDKKVAQSQVSLDVNLVKTVNLPSEEFLSNPHPRLQAWLRFANDAVDSDSDAEAIRLWYALYEDMRGRPKKGSNGAAEELKHMRDFLSHGEPLKDKDLLSFLGKKVAPGTTQFDPTNRAQLKFVTKYRQEIRSFVEKELAKELP